MFYLFVYLAKVILKCKLTCKTCVSAWKYYPVKI